MTTTTGRQPVKWQPQEQRFGGRLADLLAQQKAAQVRVFADYSKLEARVLATGGTAYWVGDEDVCEVPEGWGSVEELESIMSTMPAWAEGQRAYRSGAPCPYTDWRAATWAKGRAAAQEHYSVPAEPEQPAVAEACPCCEDAQCPSCGAPYRAGLAVCEYCRQPVKPLDDTP